MRHILYLCLSVLSLSVAVFLFVLTTELQKVSSEVLTYISEVNEQQQQLKMEAEVASAVVGGIVTYGFTSYLEQEGLISPTEASMIKNDAITMVSESSETYGQILQAVNDRMIEGSKSRRW